MSDPAGTFQDVKVEVVRSARRQKTVQAREVDGVLRVSIPASMTVAEEARWVAEMVRRSERRSAAAAIDLAARGERLAAKFGLRQPTHIRWSDSQEWRWGSCTPATGSIRISSRLTREPAWVLDYVIIHELAHLEVAGHGVRFWRLVNRYPLAERARGFLIARSIGPGPGGPLDPGRLPDDPDVDLAGDRSDVDTSAGAGGNGSSQDGAGAGRTDAGRTDPGRTRGGRMTRGGARSVRTARKGGVRA